MNDNKNDLTNSLFIEKHSIDFIPLNERSGKAWHLWPIWFTGNAHLATLAVGTLGIGLGGGLMWMILAILLGCALGTFFMAFHAAQGPQLGLPQMIQSRPQFGYYGAVLVSIFALITYVGFNVFNLLLAEQAANQLIGSTSAKSYLWFTSIAIIIAIFGYHLIHLLQRWLAYILIIMLAFFSMYLFYKLLIEFSSHSLIAFNKVAFFSQFFAAAAYQLSWSIYVSDYSRYLPPQVKIRKCFWWTYIGAFMGGAWMMLIGAIVAEMNHSNIIEALEVVGNSLYPNVGTGLLFLCLLGLLTITAINFYGASLTLLSVIDTFIGFHSTRIKRIISLIVLAILTNLLAIHSEGQFMSRFNEFLEILLYLFTPWTAINLIDFYLLHKGHYIIAEIFNANGIYGRWNWRGWLAYILGIVSMIPFFRTGIYVGAATTLLGGVDVAMIVGLLVSSITYILISYRILYKH